MRAPDELYFGSLFFFSFFDLALSLGSADAPNDGNDAAPIASPSSSSSTSSMRALSAAAGWSKFSKKLAKANCDFEWREKGFQRQRLKKQPTRIACNCVFIAILPAIANWLIQEKMLHVLPSHQWCRWTETIIHRDCCQPFPMLSKCFRWPRIKFTIFCGIAKFTRMSAGDILITANAVNDLALCVTSNECINTHTKKTDCRTNAMSRWQFDMANKMSSVAFAECYRKRRIMETICFIATSFIYLSF